MPAAPAIPAAGGRSDRAVEAPSIDHRRQRLLGEHAAQSLRPTFWHPQVREAVLVSRADAERLGLANGDPVVLHSDAGEYRGRVHIAPVTPGSLQVHWPEGQVLIDRRRRSPQAGLPDFNAFCTLQKADAPEPAPAPSG